MKFALALLVTFNSTVGFAEIPRGHYESKSVTNHAELRRALEFLNGRVEIQNETDYKKVKTSGLVVAGLGVATMLAGWSMRYPHPHHNPVALDFFLGGLAVVATGLLINVGGQLYPVFRRYMIGDDSSKFLKGKNLGIFFSLPIDRQYFLAAHEVDLEEFFIDLAESYGFVVQGS